MRTVITNFLADHNFVVSSVADAEGMKRFLARGVVDLVLLDIKLASEDGLDLLRELRTSSDVPVILITGHRLDEIDRVIGLELGADDYVLKPFHMRELLARVRAILRRAGGARQERKDGGARGHYRFAGWELRAKQRALTSPAGEPVPLTAGDFALLFAFVRAPGQILSREQLLSASHVHDDVFDRSIDVQILRLRRKIEPDPSKPQLITTVRGAGYLLDAEVERVA